ncbi:MAG TPA: hypothetical protein VMR98_02635, partial [Candidatus Polarisedimenticolaceae bacterium]|nr:hypothetical protein [Candidatus Polarisedimenticolaceae bacterium]
FRTDGGILGLPWNVFALSGFWGDRQDRYVLMWDHFQAWPVVMGVLAVFIVAGAVWCVRRRDCLGVSLMITGLIAALLALGDGWGPVAPLNHWLAAHVPFFEGYREPQKFVALTALAYAYLGGRFVGWMQGRVWVPRFAVVPLVLLPLLTASTILWGGGGQLKPVNYPADWYAANRYLNERHAQKSLFLPWHQYMIYGFTNGRIIANPAPQFFDTPVVAGDNPELADNERLSDKTRYIGRLSAAAQKGEDVGGVLRANGYRYVLLSKTLDYGDYLWLDKQPDIKLVKDGPTLRIYEVVK